MFSREHLENTAAISAIDMEPYRKRLRDLGYIERQNIAFEPRYYEGKIERLSDLAAELTGENGVRVILVDLSFSEL
ncbi:MAG: ABC transporter substrate-binding protein [Deltaproteobacteria bacterium]|nr:ABC transporter substrate-binding protein [Deltaproteobacteria bacterium]